MIKIKTFAPPEDVFGRVRMGVAVNCSCVSLEIIIVNLVIIIIIITRMLIAMIITVHHERTPGHWSSFHCQLLHCFSHCSSPLSFIVVTIVVIFILVANLIKGNIGWDFGGIDDNTNS